MGTINQEFEIVRVFTDVNKIIKQNMRKEFEAMGVTMPQGLVLGTLLKHGEMKISDLSARVNLSNSTVTGIIDRLENQQLVARTRSEEDRRIIYINVTPKVKGLYQEIFRKAEAIFEDLLSSGSPEELEKIYEGLSILKQILKNRNEREIKC